MYTSLRAPYKTPLYTHSPQQIHFSCPQTPCSTLHRKSNHPFHTPPWPRFRKTPWDTREGWRLAGVITRFPGSPGGRDKPGIWPLGSPTHPCGCPLVEEWAGEGRRKTQALLAPDKATQPLLGVTSHASPSLRGPLPLVQRSQGSITKDPVTGPAHRGAGHLILELRG